MARSEAAKAARRRSVRISPPLTNVRPRPRTSPPTAPRTGVNRDVAEVVGRYTPTFEPARRLWPDIREQVLDLVVTAKPGGPSLAIKYLRALARHVAVQVAGGHVVDDLPTLFSDTSLVRTFGTGGKPTSRPGAGPDAEGDELGERSLATELTYLRRIRATILPDVYGAERRLQRPAPQTKAPYTDDEVSARLAFFYSTSSPRLNPARAVPLLGLSAGLDGYESQRVTGRDVLVTEWGLVVRTRGASRSQARPPRLVPILADFETRLAALATAAGDAPLIGAKRDGTQRATFRAVEALPAEVRIHGGQARSWWTRELIRREVPLLALRQAGVSLLGDKVIAVLSEGLVMPFDRFVTVTRAGTTPFAPTAMAGLEEWDGEYRRAGFKS